MYFLRILQPEDYTLLRVDSRTKYSQMSLVSLEKILS